MKKVQMYQSKDGKLFKFLRDAKRHWDILRTVNSLRETLVGKNAPSDMDFSNGSGFYLLNPDRIRKFDNLFVIAIKKYEPRLYKQMKDAKVPITAINGFVGRWLCDSDSPFYSLTYLRSCVNGQSQYWGQPYYANANSGSGTDRKLGDIL